MWEGFAAGTCQIPPCALFSLLVAASRVAVPQPQSAPHRAARIKAQMLQAGNSPVNGHWKMIPWSSIFSLHALQVMTAFLLIGHKSWFAVSLQLHRGALLEESHSVIPVPLWIQMLSINVLSLQNGSVLFLGFVFWVFFLDFSFFFSFFDLD